jgi:hypothetical protein
MIVTSPDNEKGEHWTQVAITQARAAPHQHSPPRPAQYIMHIYIMIQRMANVRDTPKTCDDKLPPLSYLSRCKPKHHKPALRIFNSPSLSRASTLPNTGADEGFYS